MLLSRRYISGAMLFSRRYISGAIPKRLIAAIEEQGAISQSRINLLKKKSNVVVSNGTIKTVLGGMRGPPLLLCETSEVDPNKGVTYRGYPLLELANKLPKPQACTSSGAYINSSDINSSDRSSSQPPLAESLLWLLLTGQLPSIEESEALRRCLVSRMHNCLPIHVAAVINSFPPFTHPMTQLIAGIAALQTQSEFARRYQEGHLKKNDFWKHILDDGLTLIAVLPRIAGLIYKRSCKPLREGQYGTVMASSPDTRLDWGGNIASLLGFDQPEHADMLRFYIFLHADHEGGNVSAHTAHLVGSALSDPFLSFAASMAGLAGPLHGLANQQCLSFLQMMLHHLKKNRLPITDDNVTDFVKKEMLDKGQVIPGFGHAALRVEDPRFTAQKIYAEERNLNDELLEILRCCIRVVPPILMATGKVSSPWPNVDAHSGAILHHYGLRETSFYTVLFGLSRSLGVVSQLVWDRLLGLPIERPKSISIGALEKLVI